MASLENTLLPNRLWSRLREKVLGLWPPILGVGLEAQRFQEAPTAPLWTTPRPSSVSFSICHTHSSSMNTLFWSSGAFWTLLRGICIEIWCWRYTGTQPCRGRLHFPINEDLAFEMTEGPHWLRTMKCAPEPDGLCFCSLFPREKFYFKINFIKIQFIYKDCTHCQGTVWWVWKDI